MSLKDRITEDMKAAMRPRQTARLSAIRMLLAASKQREVADRVLAGDTLVRGTYAERRWHRGWRPPG